jgi:hypothetical protein
MTSSRRAGGGALKKGCRIRLDYTADAFTKLRPRDCDTIGEPPYWTDDILGADGLPVVRISVKWDQGSHLSLIAGVDKWSRI